MPTPLLAFLLGLVASAVPVLLSHRLNRSSAGRSPEDPLPPLGDLPATDDLVALDVVEVGLADLHEAITAAAPKLPPRARRVLAAHAFVVGGGSAPRGGHGGGAAVVPNGNPFWLPMPSHGEPAGSGMWTLAPMEATTTHGTRYVLRPLRAFVDLHEGTAYGVNLLRKTAPKALAAAARGDLDGYTRGLRASGATRRNPRLFTAALVGALRERGE